MTKLKKSLLSVVALLLLTITCFGLSACGEDEAGPLSVPAGTTVSVSVGSELSTVLASVTVSYDSPDDDATKDFSATGLDAMRDKGIIVQWSGSTQQLATDKTKCRITFNYLGYSCYIEYIVGGTI